ncbi:low-density lipoprotein receptor-related protein 2-like protein, partial [Dinothrombium tinctorium]
MKICVIEYPTQTTFPTITSPTPTSPTTTKTTNPSPTPPYDFPTTTTITRRPSGRSPSATEAPVTQKCALNQFQCRIYPQCIDKTLVCDGKSDCYDSSDEGGSAGCINITNKCRGDDHFRCADGTCIDRIRLCDARADCGDGSDELGCVYDCKENEFRCNDGQCIPARYRCSNTTECRDRSDELNCRRECRREEFECEPNECIALNRRCDGKVDCRNAADEQNCIDQSKPNIPIIEILTCAPDEFKCASGLQCISAKLRCDKRFDCFDNSDETDCGMNSYYIVCGPNQFQCRNKQCVDVKKVCDRRKDCEDNSDEYNCGPKCSSTQFQCKNGDCVDINYRCDGERNCADSSDEEDCGDKAQEKLLILLLLFFKGDELNVKVYPERQTIRQNQEVVFRCRDEGQRRAPVKWSRADNAPLPRGSIDYRGRLTMPMIQPEHAGVYLCTAQGVLMTVPGAQRAANLIVTPSLAYYNILHFLPQSDTYTEDIAPTSAPTPPPRQPGQCSRNEATCSNGECISREFVCDGDYDCTDKSDELTCTSRCEPNEFQCENRAKCILKVWRCDGDDDCGDGSDEKGCEPAAPGSPCRYSEFTCAGGDQCIPKAYHCDGQFDCQDKSDEIGCVAPTIVEPPIESIIVSEGANVSITCRAVGTPTPIISWRLNWNHIPGPPRVTTTSVNGFGTVLIKDAQPSDQGAWSCEAINSKDSKLASQDCILTVKPKAGICSPPYFNDKARSSSECLRCYCSSRTDTCYSSNLRVVNITLEGPISVVALQKVDDRYINIGTQHPPNQNAINVNPATREHKIDRSVSASTAPEDTFYYWSLPSEFLGNKLNSYGGHLKFSILYVAPYFPRVSRAADVIISGGGTTLYHIVKDEIKAGQENTIRARFWEGEWDKSEAVIRGEAPALEPTTREDIMNVLRNIDHIYIRATYDRERLESSIFKVEMETAMPANTTQLPQAVFVEKCSCPEGYIGNSCEDCAPGFIRQGTACYKQQITFSQTCFLDTDGDVTCNACPLGYEGRRCERCAPGYTGNPLTPYGECKRIESGPQKTIVVNIEEPKAVKVVAGSTVTFRCNSASELPHNLVWTKEGGPLPSHATEISGVLTIRDVRPEDAGKYVCTGSNLESVDQDHATLTVETVEQPQKPKVTIYPVSQRVRVGESVEFQCSAEGNPRPTLRLYRGRNEVLNPSSTFDQIRGIFYIRAVEKSDEGEYFCTATNSAGSHTQRAVLIVEGAERPPGNKPYVEINPTRYEARRGGTARFDCRASGTPQPEIQWVFSNGPLPEGSSVVGGILTLQSVTEAHAGSYRCIATNAYGTTEALATLFIEGGDRVAPSVRVEPERQTVVQGHSGELRCIATGSPLPTVTWSRVGGELTSRHKAEGNILKILEAMVEDRGLYVCKGQNSEGIAQAAGIVEIERREIPAIELYPESSQVVAKGNSALFQCRIMMGIPTPTVEWTRADGRPFSTNTELLNGGVILFNRVTGEEDGTYECKAENVAGRVTAQAVLR